VASFTPQPLYLWGKDHWYQLDSRLSGPQNWSGCRDKEEKSLPLPGIEHIIQPVT